MSAPASERAEPIAPNVHLTHTLRPSNGARTAQRAVPTTALNTYSSPGEGPIRARPGERPFPEELCPDSTGLVISSLRLRCGWLVYKTRVTARTAGGRQATRCAIAAR